MKVFIPENLELSSRHREKYYYIVGRIYREGSLNHKHNELSYISLHSDILGQILGGNYRKLLLYLIDNGVIETDNSYIKGKKSKGYRLTKTYRDKDFKVVELHEKILCSKIESRRNAQLYSINSDDNLFYLYKNLINIELDEKGALEYVENNVHEVNKKIAYRMAIEEIMSKHFYSTNQNKVGRLFTNVSSFPSVLRPYLSYNGKDLAEVDIANSQPLFFNILISRYLSTHTISISPLYNSSYVYSKNTSTSCYGDVFEYKKLTEEGRLYEYLMENMNVQEDRATFKKKVFGKIFYCDESSNYTYTERKVFKELFPTVSTMISYYKKDEYQNLPIELQKVEANLILNNVTTQLKDSSIYALTIHDSILTTKENANEVKSIMETEFRNKFNLNPTIRIK